eukprot:m51a1_g8879 putative beta-glucosidase (465) ;mRNA; f:632479-634041
MSQQQQQQQEQDRADEALLMSAASPLRRAGFAVGFATSEYQSSGSERCPLSTWAAFERSRLGWGPFSRPAIRNGDRSGAACRFWDDYARDFALARSAGANAFRLSLEWSALQPAQGPLCPAAVAHYHAVLAELRGRGLGACATLLHFTLPAWFAELGGFERAENAGLFADFCARAYDEFAGEVALWCTVNEPGVAALCGYVLGLHWPGRLLRWGAAREVAENMVRGHREAYAAIKAAAAARGLSARVGVVHNALAFEATLPCTPAAALCAALTRLAHTGVVEALGGPQGIRECNDFFGLNFYSRALLNGLALFPTALAGETMTEMGWATCPAAFERALREACSYGVPVYVTENGGERQVPFLRGYLAVLARCMGEGCDVRGYFWWTLLDNFEWDRGWGPKFGLYAYDHTTGAVSKRPGVDYFARVFAKAPEGQQEQQAQQEQQEQPQQAAEAQAPVPPCAIRPM